MNENERARREDFGRHPHLYQRPLTNGERFERRTGVKWADATPEQRRAEMDRSSRSIGRQRAAGAVARRLLLIAVEIGIAVLLIRHLWPGC